MVWRSQSPSLFLDKVYFTFRGPDTVSLWSWMNDVSKAACPDNIPPPCTKKTCANLTFLTYCCPHLLQDSRYHPCTWKSLPCHTDHHPVARTAMKCFEKLVVQHIRDIIPASLDPRKYAFWTNRPTVCHVHLLQVKIVTILFCHHVQIQRNPLVWSA